MAGTSFVPSKTSTGGAWILKRWWWLREFRLGSQTTFPSLSAPPPRNPGPRSPARGVEASGRPVQADAAIDLDSWHRLVRLGRARHGLERSTLEHDRLQSALARALGRLDRADGTLEVIGIRVDVEVDHACSHLVLGTPGGRRLRPIH